MSDPAIGTLSVRFSDEELRLIEDFAHISGVTVEQLIRQALFLPPLDTQPRRHLRLVRGAVPDSDAASRAIRAGASA